MKGIYLLASEYRADANVSIPSGQSHLRAWLFEKMEGRLKLIKAPGNRAQGQWISPPYPRGVMFCSGLPVNDKGCRHELRQLRCCEHGASTWYAWHAQGPKAREPKIQQHALVLDTPPYWPSNNVPHNNAVLVNRRPTNVPVTFSIPPAGSQGQPGIQPPIRYTPPAKTYSRFSSISDRSGSWTSSSRSSASSIKGIPPNAHSHRSLASESGSSSTLGTPFAGVAHIDPVQPSPHNESWSLASNGSPRRHEEHYLPSSRSLPPSLASRGQNVHISSKSFEHTLSIKTLHQQIEIDGLRNFLQSREDISLQPDQFKITPGRRREDITLAFQTHQDAENALRALRACQRWGTLEVDRIDSIPSNNGCDEHNPSDRPSGLKIVTCDGGRAQRME